MLELVFPFSFLPSEERESHSSTSCQKQEISDPLSKGDVTDPIAQCGKPREMSTHHDGDMRHYSERVKDHRMILHNI